MKPLLDLADRHLVTTGLVGTASGAGAISWLLSALNTAGDIATPIGKIAGAACAVLTLILLYDRWRDHRRRGRPFRNDGVAWRRREWEDDNIP